MCLDFITLFPRNYQTDTTTIRAAWDVTGDPCPVTSYEWAIERLDGKVVQNFISVSGKSSFSFLITIAKTKLSTEINVKLVF